MTLFSAMASSSLLLLLLLSLLLPLPLPPPSLSLEILRALFFLAGVLLTGDSSLLLLTDLSVLSLRLGVLVSCGSRAGAHLMMLQMWVLVMDSSPSVSPSLPPGSAKADHAAASPVSPPPVPPPVIAWTMSRILLTPLSPG
jgi:hypothetical protein